MNTVEYNYWLANIKGIGAIRISQLLQIYHSSEELYHTSRDSLLKTAILTEEEVDVLINSRQESRIKEAYQKLINSNIQFITREDSGYPERLKLIYGAPFALYVKGTLPPDHVKTLAVIGARDCTAYGIEMARYLSGSVAREGIRVISGLARGIDSHAHAGTLQAGGITYGILGCGIDICYPRENLKLYMELQKEGGVISEYPPGTQPLACNFPMRNRIISGLSDGILVIEARKKSGTLITVDLGLDQGKNIYALPGRVTDSLSTGCNNLIKLGAKPVTTPEDILEDFQIYPATDQTDSVGPNGLNQEEQKILRTLSLEPKHIEAISMETELPIHQLMEHLLSLEMKEIIRQTVRNYYITIQRIVS